MADVPVCLVVRCCSAVYHVMSQVLGPTNLVGVAMPEGGQREVFLGVLVQLGILLCSDDGSSVSPGYPVIRTALMQVTCGMLSLQCACPASSLWAARLYQSMR